MILSGHQPVYLPGIIVMNKIALSDRFMFVGHCDFQHRSWQNHNWIWGINGAIKLTVPVHKGKTINDTFPLGDGHWQQTHLTSIRHNYSKSEYFDDYYPELAVLLCDHKGSLADLNISLIGWLMECLGIDTPTFKSEDFDIQGSKTAMLADMCSKLGANHYLSSPGEIEYVDKQLMNGYGHSFQQFTHPIYSQAQPKRKPFIPDLSVIDLLFNMGPDAAKIVRESGRIQ